MGHRHGHTKAALLDHHIRDLDSANMAILVLVNKLDLHHEYDYHLAPAVGLGVDRQLVCEIPLSQHVLSLAA